MRDTNKNCTDLTGCQHCIDCNGLFFALGCIGLHADQHGDCAQYQFYCADCVNDSDRCMRCEERMAAYYSQNRRYFSGQSNWVGVLV